MPIDEHLIQLVASVSRIETKLDSIADDIRGTESEPGLKQRVDDLEASRDKVRGFGILGSIVLGLGEFIFHYITWHKGGKP